jgi:hypothetical protein
MSMNTRLHFLAPLLLLLACDRTPPAGAGAGGQAVAGTAVRSGASGASNASSASGASGASGSPGSGSGAAPKTAASAAPQATARPIGPKVSLVTALKGGKNRTMRLSLERDGEDVWGYLVDDREGQGMLLKGKMLDDRRFVLTEGGRSKSPSSLKGELDGSTPAKLTWTEARARPLALTTTALVPFGKGQEGDAGFSGSIGDRLRIRAQIKREGTQLTGYYRYARSKDDLKLIGSVDPATGKFSMTEMGTKGAPSGRLRGVFLDANHMTGSWESIDASRSLPLWLASSKPLPRVLALPGGGKVVPHEVELQPGPHCTRSSLFPEFDGLKNRKAQDSLNKLLGRSQSPSKSDRESCDGATAEFSFSFDDSYAVTSSKRPGYLGLQTSGYEYTGGAHGMPYSSCSVVDLSEGKLIQLHTLLAPGALARLSEIASRKLREENKVSDLNEAGFFEKEIKVSDKPDLCLGDDEITLDFSVYEIAPYAMGAPSISLTFAELKPLMRADPLVTELLK